MVIQRWFEITKKKQGNKKSVKTVQYQTVKFGSESNLTFKYTIICPKIDVNR